MCVDPQGVAMPDIGKDDSGFEGKCQKVDMCQLQSQYNFVLPGRVQLDEVADEEAGIAD